MATHQRPQTLARAIASLRAQTDADFELLLVADQLDPETAVVAARDLGPQDRFLSAPARTARRKAATRVWPWRVGNG